MFIYKNNRVHIAGLSFVIPDGCILNWMNTEVEIKGFSALTPNEKIKFSLLPIIRTIPKYSLSARSRLEELVSLFKDNKSYTFHTDIIPIHKYGMDGYSLTFSSENVYVYDEYFDLAEIVDGIYQIRIGVSAYDGVTIEEALQHPMVREFMDSLHREQI